MRDLGNHAANRGRILKRALPPDLVQAETDEGRSLTALAARRAWYEKRLLWPASSVIGALALVWLLKRAFALELAPWLGG